MSQRDPFMFSGSRPWSWLTVAAALLAGGCAKARAAVHLGPSCEALLESEQALVGSAACNPKVEPCVDARARRSWSREIYCGGGSYVLRADAATKLDVIDETMVAMDCPAGVWSTCPAKPAPAPPPAP